MRGFCDGSAEIAVDGIREIGVAVEFAVEISARRKKPVVAFLFERQRIRALKVAILLSDMLESAAARCRVGVTAVERVELGAQTVLDSDPPDIRIEIEFQNVNRFIEVFAARSKIR